MFTPENITAHFRDRDSLAFVVDIVRHNDILACDSGVHGFGSEGKTFTCVDYVDDSADVHVCSGSVLANDGSALACS